MDNGKLIMDNSQFSISTYPVMKDSGVEWIGEIPEGWEVKPFKRFATIGNGRDHKNVWDINGKYPIIGSGGVFGCANKYLYDRPSVILGRKGTIDKPQFITEPFWTVDTAYFTDIYENTDKRFFYYLCLTINFDLYKYGSAVPSMTSETLSQIPFCSPELGEQTTIANYLDRKTAEIDELIAQKERLLELYEEEKTAIINQAVTKGIDPDVKLKDSGIDWLGEIPEGWEVKKLKYVLSIGSGDGIKSKSIKDIGDYPVYGGNGLVGYTDKYNNNDKIFVIGRVGAKCGNVRLISGKKWISDNALYAYTESNFNFIKHCLISKNFNRLANKNAQPLITSTMIKEESIFYPPPEEQTAIVHHIETETARINAKIARTKKIIELQKEYRTALISEVVTGKIKVTQEAAS